MTSSSSTADWSAGAAYVDGQVTPIKDAKIPITDWGYRRSDVTYDVVGVYFGAFFRLDDHLQRFRTSMGKLRMKPEESDEDIKRILTDLVRRTGLREAYVAMDCVRGKPAPGLPYHPAYGRAYLVCFAIPWVWLFSEEQQARGVHAMIAKTPRIPPESVDPTVKNFHWGDLTAALFEAHDAGADTAVLLDQEGIPDRGAGLQYVRRDRRHGGQSAARCARRHHPAVGERTLRRAGHSARHPADLAGRAGRCGRDLLFDHRRGDHARQPAGLAHPRQRPAGPISARLRETFWEKRRQGWHATPIDYDATS